MFDLNSYYRLRNANGDTLNLSAFNGSSSLVVWKKDVRGKPAIKIKVSPIYAKDLAKKLKSAMDSNREERVPSVLQDFNHDSKKYEVIGSICFVRDDKGMISVEINANGTGAKFDFRASQIFSDGTNPVPKEVRSIQGAEEFIDVLRVKLPQADLLSTYGNSKPGSKGAAKQDPFAGKQTQQQPADTTTTSDDDFPF